jgi:hypothetical protein
MQHYLAALIPLGGSAPMVNDSYRQNQEYRQRVDGEIRQAVQEFQAGSLGVIALARRLSGYRFIVERERPDLAATLFTFTAVDSDTDDLPARPPRLLWYPSTAESEDHKLQLAEEQYFESVNRACVEVTRLLA